MSPTPSEPQRSAPEAQPSLDRTPGSNEPASAEQDEDARLFYERLQQVGQLVDVDAHTDVAALPAHVTHIRYPDGTVKRLRFTAS